MHTPPLTPLLLLLLLILLLCPFPDPLHPSLDLRFVCDNSQQLTSLNVLFCELTYLLKTIYSIGGKTFIWPWTDEIFCWERYLTCSVWLSRKMKNPPINRIGRDTGKVPLIGCLTTDSDWWGIGGRITHHWRRHPWVNSSSDETPAELWVDMDRTSERNINLDYYSNVFRKWQQLSCCEWAYLCSPCRCPLRWTCALRYTDNDTLQLAPTGHFISVVKDGLTCLSLTAQPPLYSSQSENLSNVVQHTVNTSNKYQYE